MKKLFHIFLLLFTIFCWSAGKGQCNTWFPYFSSGNWDCTTNQASGNYIINGNPPPITYTIVNAITNATFYAGVANSNTGTFIPIPAGNYNVMGGNSVPGCTFATVLNVTSPFSPASLSFSAVSTCPGGSNGSATVTASPPLAAPFSYTWSSGSFAQAAYSLSAQIYTATVTDNNGCSVSNTVMINASAPMSSTFSNTMIACNGGTTSATINTNGGTAPFNYTVNGSAITGNTVTGLSAGVNTIVTLSANGCLSTNTIVVSQPSPAVISFTVTRPSCATSTNGAISSAITNAPPVLSYTWQPVSLYTQNISNIPAGSYSLTVKDGNSCLTSSVVNITALSNMSSSVNLNPENCSAADGAFTVNVAGGNGPYTYSTISVGGGTSNVFGGLSSGAYTTVITDASNCKDTLKLFLGNLSTVSVTVVNFKPVLCYGQCTGSLELSVQNAVSPVTYSATGTPTTNSNLITNLCPGLITVKVVDNIGCPATTTIHFPMPPVFSYSASNPPPVCFGKIFTLQATAFGGAGGFTYLWNPGNISAQTVTQTASASAVYSLNVYDANGCTLAPYTVTLSVNPLISIDLNASSSGICPGTTAQISPTVSGGDGLYAYNWLPGNMTSSSIFVESITVPVYTLYVNDQCGSPTAVKVVTVNLFPATSPAMNLSVAKGCEPCCTQLVCTTPKVSEVVWNYGDRPFEQAGLTSEYCYQKAGNYSIRLSIVDSNSCRAVRTFSNIIEVFKRPRASFITDPPVVTTSNGENVLIKNSSLLANEFKWIANGLPLGQSRDVRYSFNDIGCVDFRLIATNENNCSDTLDQEVCVIEGFTFWMPNAFSPNRDEVNDILIPLGAAWSEKNYVFEIYNRWGMKIFRTTDISQGWDGKVKGEIAPLDRYFWHVQVIDNLGRPYEFRGFTLLLQ